MMNASVLFCGKLSFLTTYQSEDCQGMPPYYIILGIFGIVLTFISSNKYFLIFLDNLKINNLYTLF